MNWKVIAIIVVIVLAIALGIGIVMQFNKTTEGQKAKGNIINYNFEPHQTFFGCARYNAPKSDNNTK